MAETFVSVAGNKPTGATPTDLYIAGAGLLDATVVSMRCCNVGAAQDTIRAYKVPAAGSAGVGNALLYDVPVAVGETLTLEKEFLAADEKITVESANGDITFSASIMERTA